MPCVTEGRNFKPLTGYCAKSLRTERVDRVEMLATSVWKALGSDPDRERLKDVTILYNSVTMKRN